jgi:uncharacterized protein (TIGR03435 family)
MKTALLTFLAAGSLFAQRVPKLDFDAASVKPANPEQPRIVGRVSGGPGTNDPGRITASRISLANLIFQAYALMDDQLTCPDWMRDAENYGFAMTATMPPTTAMEEYRSMLRNLLAARFHLSFHIEKQPRPGYELTVLSIGPKFKKYVPNAPSAEPDAPGVSLDARGLASSRPPLQPATSPPSASTEWCASASATT